MTTEAKASLREKRMVTAINITWCIEDVLSVRDDLSKEQASDVLMHLERYHDASVGINWDVIERTIVDLFE